MINYKSFHLPGNAKLRVRTDRIIATVSSKNSNTIDLFVEGASQPWHLPLLDMQPAQLIDYVWERENIEEGGSK